MIIALGQTVADFTQVQSENYIFALKIILSILEYLIVRVPASEAIKLYCRNERATVHMYYFYITLLQYKEECWCEI